MFLPANDPWSLFLISGVGILIIAVLALYVYSIVWSYGDARDRGKPAGLVALLVALVKWPVGLLIWLAFRPEKGERNGAGRSVCG